MRFKATFLFGQVLLLFMVCSGNVLAQKHNHNGHQHHYSQQSHKASAVSPFDGKKVSSSLHCLLKGHTQRRFCPRNSQKTNSYPVSIGVHCGGNSSGSASQLVLLTNDFMEATSPSPAIHLSVSRLQSTLLLKSQSFVYSLDPPPIIF